MLVYQRVLLNMMVIIKIIMSDTYEAGIPGKITHVPLWKMCSPGVIQCCSQNSGKKALAVYVPMILI
jgi:hypothetical protein